MSEERDFKYYNTGCGPVFQPLDIGHKDYLVMIEPETAFWMLVEKSKAGSLMCDKKFLKTFKDNSAKFKKEMNELRFGLKPVAAYLNPTEKCNLNCTYCYIPEKMRKNGVNMSEADLSKALTILKKYFAKNLPKGRRPQIIFHGSEPLVNKEVVFAAIKKHSKDFNFGVQTNATLLDDNAIKFLREHKTGIGISIDGPQSAVADINRKTWNGEGNFKNVSKVLDKLNDYEGFNVICTVTADNMSKLDKTIEYFHDNGVKTCMLNIIRCTQPKSRTVKPDEAKAAEYYMKALDKTHALYKKTGRKIIVANFANIILSIIAPTARRLMCDISPCGGGRCFFAVSAKGDIFPCSEFVGLPKYNGGNIFKDNIDDILASKTFKTMTERQTEKIVPCKTCAIQNFCGSPCPAEAYNMNGGMDKPGAFCEFYEEQVRYAFRLIADRKEQDYLWDNWDKDTELIFSADKMLL
jgi:uncharacterized protein